jgi:FG-GAP repeat
LLIPALSGAVVGVLIVSLFAFPAVPIHRDSQGLKAPSRVPALVDPQFLPTILTSTNSTPSGEFGMGVAASGPTYAVGAPHEQQYISGLTHYGEVHLQNTANGVTGVIMGPGPGGSASQFGAAVAMTSTQIVVGAWGFASGEGAAYVYDYSLTVQGGRRVLSTTEIASFLSPNAQTASGGGKFGQSVAISGNLVVVGAPFENFSRHVNAGHAYIFNLNTGSTVMLSSPAPEAYGYFGYSVAISGNRVVVGAFGETNGASVTVGRAYVFAASSGDLLTTLVSPSPTSDDAFGKAVALSGTTAVVGADLAGPGGPYYQSGAVYEFNLATNTSMSLTSSAPVQYGYFGQSVAVDSSTIVVGAPGETSNGSGGAGNAYLFSSVSGALITSEFMAPNWPHAGYFGESVAENGSDGVIVGAPYENAGGSSQAGHAYIFHQIPLTYASPNALLPTGYVSGGLFGWAVAIDNGVTVVGAPNETGPLDELTAGNAYLMRSSTGPITQLTPEFPQSGALFGASVAVWGKLVAVGAPGQTTGGASDGAVYLYSATTGSLEAMLFSPHPTTSGRFGFSVATNGSTVVVGAPGEDGGAGTAYAFQLAHHLLTTYWSPVQLNTTQPSRDQSAGNGEFGFSVAINGSTVVVGAPGENSTDGPVAQAGNAYVFNAGSGALLYTLTSPNPQSATGPDVNWGFGRSVALASGTVVVGSPGETAFGSAQAGRAYIFAESSGALLRALTSPNPVGPGAAFGWAVAANAGIVGVTALLEPAFGVSAAGNLYLFGSGTGIAFERYNSPVPTADLNFGQSVSIGHGGTVVVGQPAEQSNDALEYGSNAGLAYQFFF